MALLASLPARPILRPRGGGCAASKAPEAPSAPVPVQGPSTRRADHPRRRFRVHLWSTPEPWSDISDISDICPRTLSDTPDTCPRTPSDTPDMCPRTHRTLRTPLDAYGCPKCPKCPRTLRTHRTQPFTITESRCVLRSVEVICRGYSCMCPSFLAAS